MNAITLAIIWMSVQVVLFSLVGGVAFLAFSSPWAECGRRLRCHGAGIDATDCAAGGQSLAAMDSQLRRRECECGAKFEVGAAKYCASGW